MFPRHCHRLVGTLALGFAALCTAVGAAAADEAHELFEPLAIDVDVSLSEPHVLDHQPVRIHYEVLDHATPGQELALNLDPAFSLPAQVERVSCRGIGRVTVAGRMLGAEGGAFTIVRENQAVAAVFRVPPLGLLYETHYIGEGVHLLRQLDPEGPPDHGPCQPLVQPSIPPEPIDVAERLGHAALPQVETLAMSGCPPPLPVFDLLIVYTDVARQAAGGADAIRARCILAVEEANQAYLNSLIAARLRLVYCNEVDYAENGTFQDHINRLTDPDDGVLDGVHDIRNDYRIDLVSLFVDDNDGGTTGGVGWCQTSVEWAFTVVDWTISASNLTLAHEVGHNLNCDHDHDNEFGSPCNEDGYSFGHRFIGNDGNTYRTVMAYMPGMRIPYFSDPNIQFQGQPTGVPPGDPDEAWNALTILHRLSTCEEYRLTRYDIWVDFDAGVYQFGTYDFPYATLATGVTEILTGINASELPILWVKSGTTSETITIDKAMEMRACGGPVTIGLQP